MLPPLTKNPTLYQSFNHERNQKPYRIEHYQARTKDIFLMPDQVRETQNKLLDVLGHRAATIEYVSSEDCREFLETFLSQIDPAIRNALENAGFKAVSKYSGYDYLRAKQKLVVLSDYFLRDRGLPDRLNIAGNTKYRTRSEKIPFTSLKKSQLYQQLKHAVGRQQQFSGDLKFSANCPLSQLSDSHCRRILQSFYAKLLPSDRKAFNDLDLKGVSSFSWYSDKRAKFKLLAIWDTLKMAADHHTADPGQPGATLASLNNTKEWGKFNPTLVAHRSMYQIALKANSTTSDQCGIFQEGESFNQFKKCLVNLLESDSNRAPSYKDPIPNSESITITLCDLGGQKQMVMYANDSSGFAISIQTADYRQLAHLIKG